MSQPSTDLQSPAATFHETAVSLKVDCAATWRMVPVEPTPEMLKAVEPWPGHVASIYRRMIAAAPAASSSDAGREAAWRDAIAADAVSEAAACRHAQANATRDTDKLYRIGQKDALLLFATRVLDAHALPLPALARAGGDGWRPIAEAPYDTSVEVKAGRMTFLARLLPDVSETEAGESCDQWQAEIDGEHPPCWSGGACWSSNEDEGMSLQPTHWRPA